MKKLTYIALLSLLMVLTRCSEMEGIKLISEEAFGGTVDGKEVRLFTLRNEAGMTAQITNYGGRVVTLWVPDRNGKLEDIVSGFESLDGYLNADEKYFGALIGRYGNRIANGKFSIDGQEYTLATNNDANHLHGGNSGFESVVWDAELVDDRTLSLTYRSAHLEEGYPGNLEVKVVYTLTHENELKVEYWAETDQKTVVNLTHHSFFNLTKAGAETINDHVLQINAGHYTPILDGLIPTGEIATVKGTPFDFTQPKAIGANVDDHGDQLERGFGYDHNWVLDQTGSLTKAATVYSPVSGRKMEVLTNEPGLQFYGGNFLNGEEGKNGQKYPYRSLFCLETQHFPDSPNQPNFPSTELNPGETYHSMCIYKFSTIDE